MTRNCLNVMRKLASAGRPTNTSQSSAQRSPAIGLPKQLMGGVAGVGLGRLLAYKPALRPQGAPVFSERMHNAPTQAELNNARAAMANPKPAQPSIYENYMNKLTNLLSRRRNNNQYESADEAGRALYPQEYM